MSLYVLTEYIEECKINGKKLIGEISLSIKIFKIKGEK